MILFFWLVLLLGVALIGWVVGVKSCGCFYHWVRPFRSAPSQVIGKTFPAGTGVELQRKFLFEANGFIRSNEQRSTVVIREWDHDSKTLFVGLVLLKRSSLESNDDYEVRELPSQSSLRVSGSARTSDITPTESLQKYLGKHHYTVEMGKPVRLSGQSFHLFQWSIEEELPEPTWLQRAMESTLQLRDILVFPILLTIVALGLIGTRQMILFPIGIGLIILLSGAVKFVFLHQIKDEAEEYHLQNY